MILAAGKGTRMRELTKTTPKGLLKKKGKSLLEHAFTVLPRECEEIVIVIGYLGDQICGVFGDSWNGIPITYVRQGECVGTAGALKEAEQHLKGNEFIVLPCDDTYHETDISNLCRSAPSMLISTVQDRPVSAGNVQVENGRLVSITEGTHNPPVMVATGAYYLTDKIFDHPPVQIPGREEYGLPQTVVEYAKIHPVRIIESVSWVQVTAPEDLV